MNKHEKELTITKLVWIFVIGCLVGYFIETGYYLLKHGVFLNKQGLLYGPFKPIYGIASILLSILLNFVKEKKGIVVFLFSALIGGVFEYICSVVLEYVFGTRMWHYSKIGMHINGRVYLPYLPMWGIIGLLWLRILYPYFNKVFEKIPKIPLYIATIFISLFLIYDILISSLATMRMTERAHNIPATTKFEKYLDKRYTDEYILKRVPYIVIID